VVKPLDEALFGQRREDLKALERLGLVAVRADGTEVVHDVISGYVSKMY
jgi:hypothetical protein